MNCPAWEEKIALYTGGDLEMPHIGLLEQHLAECPACREFADDLRANLTLLRDVHSAPIAEANFTAVRARVLTELSAKRRPFWQREWTFAAAAAALVWAAIFFFARPHNFAPRQAVWQPASIPSPEPSVPPPSPSAPARPTRPRRLLAASRHVAEQPPIAEPMVVKMMTNDPDVVIYWIADK
jgi:hypothetical protein